MKQLHDLDAVEVSFVPKGANKRKLLVLKEQITPEVVPPVTPTDTPDDQAAMSPEATAALKAVVRILTPFKDEIGEEEIESALEQAGFDFEEQTEQTELEGTEEGDMADKTISQEHMNAAKQAADAAYKEQMTKNGYEKFPALGGVAKEDKTEVVTPAKASIMKADGSLDLDQVSPEMRPVVEKLFAQNKESVAKAEKLEADLTAERTERRTKEFVAKADSFKHFTGDKAELAKNLMSLESSNKALYEQVVKNLEAVEKEKETVAKQLFTELGSSAPSAGQLDAEAKMDKMVESIVQKSDGKMTKEQAFAKLLATPEGDKAYTEAKNERIARGGA